MRNQEHLSAGGTANKDEKSGAALEQERLATKMRNQEQF
jgi:hypothetical protein